MDLALNSPGFLAPEPCRSFCILTFSFFIYLFCCCPTPQPQQRGIYTTAHGNAGSPTHWVRPGMVPVSSWICFLCATTGTLIFLVFDNFAGFQKCSDISQNITQSRFVSCFHVIRLELQVLVRNNYRGKLPSPHSISREHTINMIYHCWHYPGHTLQWLTIFSILIVFVNF